MCVYQFMEKILAFGMVNVEKVILRSERACQTILLDQSAMKLLRISYEEDVHIFSRTPVSIISIREIQIFHFTCGYLLNMSVCSLDDPLTCCSAEQIFTIHWNMNMAEGVFGRCTTCLKNIFRHICDYSCSMNQSRFMKVTKSKINENGFHYIEELEVIN